MQAMHFKTGHGRREDLNKGKSEINTEHSYYSLAGGFSFLLPYSSLSLSNEVTKGLSVCVCVYVMKEKLYKWHSCLGFWINLFIYIMSELYRACQQWF